MRRVILSILVTFGIFFVVPFPFYAGLSLLTGLQPPDGASPAVFTLSVAVQKSGHALVFVLLFYFGREVFHHRWRRYAALWWAFVAMDEIGLAIGPEYTWLEAIAGMLAEAVYFPLAAFVVHRMFSRGTVPSQSTVAASEKGGTATQ